MISEGKSPLVRSHFECSNPRKVVSLVRLCCSWQKEWRTKKMPRSDSRTGWITPKLPPNLPLYLIKRAKRSQAARCHASSDAIYLRLKCLASGSTQQRGLVLIIGWRKGLDFQLDRNRPLVTMIIIVLPAVLHWLFRIFLRGMKCALCWPLVCAETWLINGQWWVVSCELWAVMWFD